jgi:hypothetical protein
VSVIACYAKCWNCMLDHDHPNKPHTWMDDEDIEAAKDVERPTTPEGWAALAQSHPCACRCGGGKGGCEFIPDGPAVEAGGQPS